MSVSSKLFVLLVALLLSSCIQTIEAENPANQFDNNQPPTQDSSDDKTTDTTSEEPEKNNDASDEQNENNNENNDPVKQPDTDKPEPENSTPAKATLGLTANNVTEDDGLITVTARLSQAALEPLEIVTNAGSIHIATGDQQGTLNIDKTDPDVYLDNSTFTITVNQLKHTGLLDINDTTATTRVEIADTIDTTSAKLTHFEIDKKQQTATLSVALDHPAQTQVYLQTNLGELIIPAQQNQVTQTFDISAGNGDIDPNKEYASLTSATGGNFEALVLSDLVLRAPPYWGTAYMEAGLITDADPTAFSGLAPNGQDIRTMYDRRVNDWVKENAYLFNASFLDGLQIEIQVNPEFGSVSKAQEIAELYAYYVGKLPTTLRKDAETMWLHAGEGSFGGGNNNFLIHHEDGQVAIANGTIEEVLLHEGTHTSIDSHHKDGAGWLAAQQADVNFISRYAFNNPTREDMAESFVPYFAVRFRPERISEETKTLIEQTMPNRLTYFDSIEWDWYPLQ